MNIHRTEVEYDSIHEGFVEGFMNAYNLVSLGLVQMQNSEVNAIMERIFGQAPVGEMARQQAEKHLALTRMANRGK
jgi:hypothetical protein